MFIEFQYDIIFLVAIVIDNAMLNDAGSEHLHYYLLIMVNHLPAHYTDTGDKNNVNCHRD